VAKLMAAPCLCEVSLELLLETKNDEHANLPWFYWQELAGRFVKFREEYVRTGNA